MNKHELTHERLKELIEYDALNGTFTWIKKPNKRICIGRSAGSVSRNRRRINIDGRTYLASRLAYLYVNGNHPSLFIDHINGNSSDDRFENLREVMPLINSQNMRVAGKASSSGLIGAMKARNNKWKSEIKINGVGVYLGVFKTKEEAHAAYLGAKRVSHKGCTI